MEAQNKSGWTIDTLKEFLLDKVNGVMATITGNDKLYQERFETQEKAITKSDASQTTYNQGHNDLSRKMEDQYKEMVRSSEHKSDLGGLKAEIKSDIKGLEEKINGSNSNLDSRLNRMAEDIKFLRESRSVVEGKDTGKSTEKNMTIAVVGMICMLITIVVLLVKLYSVKN